MEGAALARTGSTDRAYLEHEGEAGAGERGPLAAAFPWNLNCGGRKISHRAFLPHCRIDIKVYGSMAGSARECLPSAAQRIVNMIAVSTVCDSSKVMRV